MTLDRQVLVLYVQGNSAVLPLAVEYCKLVTSLTVAQS